MIVEPDFFDHWKTRRLIVQTGDPASPLMILRLWAHCQLRKRWRFSDLSGEALEHICYSTKIGGAELKGVFEACGFVKTEGTTLVVHDWEVANRILVSAWKNGAKHRLSKTTDRLPTGKRPVNRQVTGPSNLSYLSNLSSSVREKFKEWIGVRRGMGKAPKSWDKMFEEQVKWLGEFPESDQIEVLSNSIRNNYQGLFEPKVGRNGSSSVNGRDKQKRISELRDRKSNFYKYGNMPKTPEQLAAVKKIDAEIETLQRT